MNPEIIVLIIIVILAAVWLRMCWKLLKQIMGA
jgi:hypothetical protein